MEEHPQDDGDYPFNHRQHKIKQARVEITVAHLNVLFQTLSRAYSSVHFDIV